MNADKRKRYPKDWELISSKIKFERAKNCCERCGLMNGTFIKRLKHGKFEFADIAIVHQVKKLQEQNKVKYFTALKKLGVTRIILTVAHLNHNEQDNRASNLLCMCQRCHLLHDKQNNFFRAKQYQQDINQINLFQNEHIPPQ